MAQNAWVLNTSYKEQEYADSNLHLLKKFYFETTEDAISVRKDSNYVVLHNAVPQPPPKSKDKSAWNNDELHTYKFTQVGKIRSISKPQTLPYSREEEDANRKRKAQNLPLIKQRKRFVFELSGEPLGENNQFDDLAYSLYTIHNYVKPISHFQQQITSVGEKDFETIEKGWVYLYRTMFGKIANVLPFENRFEFSLMISREYKTVRFKGLPYHQLLEQLMAYIDSRIHGRGHLITATQKMLKRISQTIDEDLSPVGFARYKQSDGKGEIGDEIETQAGLFDALFEALTALELKSLLNKKDPHSERFDKMFEKREWPLNLN